MKLILPDCEIPFVQLPHNLPATKNPELLNLFNFIGEWYNKQDYILVTTSGSTGTPKKLQLKKKHLKNSAAGTYHYFAPWNKKPLLSALPAHYIAGKMMVVRALEYNLPLVWVEPSTQPLKTLQIPVQFAALVPNQVAESIDLLEYNLVEKLIIGGAPVTPQLEHRLQSASTRCFATYGMTETATHIALRPLNGSDQKEEFTFLNGITGSTNNSGLLTIHAPQLGAENLKTNDIVDLNYNSFIWRGRAGFTVNSGGLKIQPEELEKQLEGKIPFPFFFWSEPDPVLGEKLIIIVKAGKSTAAEHEVKEVLKQFITDGKLLPKKIYFTTRFQYSANNKLLREKTFEFLTKST